MTGTPISRRLLIGGAAGTAGATAIGLEVLPAIAATHPAGSLTDTMTTDAAWSAFLGASDLVWNSVPTNFYQGAFLGNGGLAAAVYQTGSAKRITWRLGDTRVRDHQGFSAGGTLFGNARLPIGDLTLNTTGDVTDVALRLSLWNAELRGTITTTNGVLNVRTFVHGKRDVLVVSASVKSGSETVSWTFTPAIARSPRLDFKPAPSGLKTNPSPTVTQNSSGGTCTQNLVAGGQTVTKWQVRSESDGSKMLLATVAHTFPDRTGGTVADNNLSGVSGQTVYEIAADHRSWWHAFYPKSFVSFPETRLQSFYWIQLYKIACATRKDRPVVATHGPWVEKTPWPGVWWNLNVQLEYWLIYATGHSELDSLSASLDRFRDNLITNVPSGQSGDSMGMARTSQEDLLTGTVSAPGSGGEVGDLTWAIHNAWLAYRHSMADNVLRDLVFPLLRKAINYYLHFLTKDSAGKYHLPSTFSPEYASTKDCNYDLALIHWGCGTLIASAKRLGITDPLAGKWQDVLSNLTKPPQDSTNGFWIGADVQLTSGHRHYSHLLWFYPLYRLDVTRNTTNRDALTKSLNHWLGFSSAKQGYTFTGSGSMYAVLGNGNQARTQLITLLDKYIQANTMYKETGPVIETPLSGAQTIHDMVVQSWGGTIRVFPGIPTGWGDMTIHNLRTEGGFQVSAVRKGGKTQFVRVKSLAGEPCKVLPGNLAGPFDVQRLGGTGSVPFTTNSDGTVSITLAQGDDVVLFTQNTAPDLTIAPATGDGKRYWGLP